MLALALVPLLLSPAPPQDARLERRITPVVSVVQAARPAVVSIQIVRPPQQILGLTTGGSEELSGSGVVVFPDGYIVTNYHVVRNRSKKASLIVRFDEGDDAREYEARVISAEEREDLALLKIDGERPFPTIPLGALEPILGEDVIAIGHPKGQRHTVSKGIISGLDRTLNLGGGRVFDDLIQTDASINPGNSGGPLLDINGDLVGINIAMNTNAENIGFAIPVARVRRVLYDSLLSVDSARGWLGVDFDEEELTATRVFRSGPAQLAGIQVGDRLRRFDGTLVEDYEAFRRALLNLRQSRPAPLQLERDGQLVDATLNMWNQRDGKIYEHTGLRLESVSLNLTPFLQVVAVEEDGPTSHLGLKPGDVINTLRPKGWPPLRAHTKNDLVLLLQGIEKSGPNFEVTIEIWSDDDGDKYFEHTKEYSELYEGTFTMR